jgi:hypothetical protein
MRTGRPKAQIDSTPIEQLRVQGLSWRAIARALGFGCSRVRRAFQACAKSVPKIPVETGSTCCGSECCDEGRFLAGSCIMATPELERDSKTIRVRVAEWVNFVAEERQPKGIASKKVRRLTAKVEAWAHA